MNRPGAPRGGSNPFGVEPASGAEPVQVSRFIRETLEAYAPDSVADEVLRTALALGRMSSLPTAAEPLRELIEVHLVQSATAVMGEELAEAVRQRLGPLVSVVAQLESAQRTSPPPAAPTPQRITLVDPNATPVPFDDRTPTREVELRPFSVVQVVGREPDVATQLKESLDARTAVIPVDEPARLVRDLRVLRAQARMLIVDVRKPHALLDAVRSEPSLLDGAIVLLWGATRELDADMKRAFPTARMVRCVRDASIGDLAAVVRLGPGK